MSLQASCIVSLSILATTAERLPCPSGVRSHRTTSAKGSVLYKKSIYLDCCVGSQRRCRLPGLDSAADIFTE